jgi:hypothetical protein
MKTSFRVVTVFLLAALPVLLLGAISSPAFGSNNRQQAAGGEIAGVVFFDNNGNGVRDTGESGIAGVSVAARDAATGGQVYNASTTTGADGAYRFPALNPATYLVTETDRPDCVSTTGNTRSVVVENVPVSGVDFGDALPVTLSGIVFDDRNQDGFQGLDEAGIPDALVEVLDDANANGVPDPGEALLASTTTDLGGAYVVGGLTPGARVVRVTTSGPGGSSGGGIEALQLLSDEVAGASYYVNFALVLPTGGAASLDGTIWNDADGNEQIGTDETPLPGVRLWLYRDSNSNGQIDAGDVLSGTVWTDQAGYYGFGELAPVAYVLQVDESTLPAGWIASLDPAALAFVLASGQHKRLDVGYYDPLVVAPLRVSEWKKELKQAGHPHYTPAELGQIITTAEAASQVFPEAVSVRDALVQPAPRPEDKARKQHAALQLNLASNRLLPGTPVRLPELTDATTVAAAVAEIEGLLWPPATQPASEYRRAEAIAKALNSGEGLGSGLTGSARPSHATHKGNEVASHLKRDGKTVDLYEEDNPIYLLTWNAGNLNPTTIVVHPQIRLTVATFYNGGVLEVVQVRNGQMVVLGTAVPSVWNTTINATYTFDLWNVTTLGGLANTELRIYTRDPDSDPGPKEHIKVDAAELTFDY